MEEKTPFCPLCGAPQIRVPSPAKPQEQAEQEFLNTPPPPADSGTRFSAIAGAGFNPAKRVLWKSFSRIVLPMAALVGIATAMFPLGLLILLPASVVCGIYLYRRRQQLGPITASLGARLGAFTGLLSFAFFLIVSVVAIVPNKAEYREDMIKALQDAVARNPSPQG